MDTQECLYYFAKAQFQHPSTQRPLVERPQNPPKPKTRQKPTRSNRTGSAGSTCFRSRAVFESEVRLYIYIYMCVCVCVYIYTYTFTITVHVCMHACMHVCMSVCMCVCMHVYMCIGVCVYIYIYIRVHIYIYIHTCISHRILCVRMPQQNSILRSVDL